MVSSMAPPSHTPSPTRRAVDRVPDRFIQRLGSEPAAATRGVLQARLRTFEQLIPLILAAHGVLLLWYFGGAPGQWTALVAAALSGVATSVVPLREGFTRLARAILILGVAGFLLIGTGGTASHFVLWLFVLVSTYPFVLTLTASMFYIAAACGIYLATFPVSDPAEPVVVVLSRAALLIFLGLLMRQASQQLRRFGKVQRLAITDDLTGISNRRHFFRVAEREFERARRYGTGLTAVLVDLDRFKEVNDTYGHASGDLALREIAAILRDSARSVDTIARIGGDEFAMLLPQTSTEGARILVSRIKKKFKESEIRTPNGAIEVSFSAGVASLSEDTTSVGELLVEADTAMYEHKRSGVTDLSSR